MVRKVLYPAVFVLVALMASSAFALGGGWSFNAISTLNYTAGPYPYNQVDGRIYMPDGTTLVGDGSLVQIIIGLDGADIVDPKEYFDANDNGGIEGLELEALAAWVQAGADPMAISGGTNVLAYGTQGFTGEFGTTGGAVTWVAPSGLEPTILNGFAQDKLAWRSWSLTKEDLLKWCNLAEHPEMFGVELWYTDGRELGTHANGGAGPDTGWWIGMPDVALGGDITLWTGFSSPIGAEVYDHFLDPPGGTALDRRGENKLDTYLGTCVPEPSTMLLIGGALLLMVIRRKK